MPASQRTVRRGAVPKCRTVPRGGARRAGRSRQFLGGGQLIGAPPAVAVDTAAFQVSEACVRCSLLWPDPSQQSRLIEIRDNLKARIAEAQREGWLGEVEGLRISYLAWLPDFSWLSGWPSAAV
jgi:hypothetical protein